MSTQGVNISQFETEPGRPGRFYLQAQGTPRICFVASDKILEEMESQTVDQAVRVSRLPGCVGTAVMPDAHPGAGPCIGFVGAFDAKRGVLPPYGVGADIACGMRIVKTNLTLDDFNANLLTKKEKAKLAKRNYEKEDLTEPQAARRIVMRRLIDEFGRHIPLGHDRHPTSKGLSREALMRVVQLGVGAFDPDNSLHWKPFVQHFGDIQFSDDFRNVEEYGMPVDPDGITDENLPPKVFEMARCQVGTLGSGNHFI